LGSISCGKAKGSFRVRRELLVNSARFHFSGVTADVFGNAIANAIVSETVLSPPKGMRNATKAEKAAYRAGVPNAGSPDDVFDQIFDPFVNPLINAKTGVDELLRSRGVGSFEALSAENQKFKTGMFLVSWALGGLPKAVVNFTIGEKIEEYKQEFLAPAKAVVSEFVGI
jgi:hypothetical protein